MAASRPQEGRRVDGPTDVVLVQGGRFALR